MIFLIVLIELMETLKIGNPGILFNKCIQQSRFNKYNEIRGKIFSNIDHSDSN